MTGSRADLERDPSSVARMFDAVASRYDVTNTVLSFGRDRAWRRATRALLTVGPGDTVLDIAAGTGVSTVELARTGARCLAADFSRGMLVAGRSRLVARHGTSPVPFVAADALALPLPDATVDAVVMSFGLRNVVDPDAALREFARVTRPGGTLVICEFSRPTWTPFRRMYTDYLMRALPRVARAVSSNPRCLRLPRRVDPGLAGPGGARRSHRRGGMAGGELARPHRRHRRAARRHPGLSPRVLPRPVSPGPAAFPTASCSGRDPCLLHSGSALVHGFTRRDRRDRTDVGAAGPPARTPT